ncbi:Putative odorant receptor 45b [Dufourea novaeangliae]|nr:Putative odorant receptor 45b [Dufourea novaeangliae]
MKSPSTVSLSVKYGLHFIGIWPGTPCPGLHKVLWVTCMMICQSYQYGYMIVHFKTDSLVTIIDCLSIALPFTLVFIKLIVAWMNHSVLCDILSTMEEDCEKYARFDTNNFISKTADLSFRITTVIPSLYLISAGFYAAGTFAVQNANDSRELLHKMDLPFDSNESPAYELVILHVGCHVDVLCQILTTVSPDDNGQLRFVLSRHQEITIFTKKIEKLFTYIALSQLVSNTLITCCVGFLIAISIQMENGLPLLIKSITFYFVICLEVFIYCFAGEYLDIKSNLLGSAAYNSLWYDSECSKSRQIVLLLLRSRKGFPLTFGKFSTLNLESFTSVSFFFIHSNYSFFCTVKSIREAVAHYFAIKK